MYMKYAAGYSERSAEPWANTLWRVFCSHWQTDLKQLIPTDACSHGSDGSDGSLNLVFDSGSRMERLMDHYSVEDTQNHSDCPLQPWSLPAPLFL